MPVKSLDREEQLKAGKEKGEIKEEDSGITCVCQSTKLQLQDIQDGDHLNTFYTCRENTFGIPQC